MPEGISTFKASFRRVERSREDLRFGLNLVLQIKKLSTLDSMAARIAGKRINILN
jgi:hypothetical protein